MTEGRMVALVKIPKAEAYITQEGRASLRNQHSSSIDARSVTPLPWSTQFQEILDRRDANSPHVANPDSR